MRTQLMKCLVLAAFTASGLAYAADVKVGYIDMQRAIQSTKAGKKAKEQLEKEFKKKKEDLDKKEADLRKISEDLQKKASVMTDEARQQRQQSFNEEMVKYREMVQKSQTEIQKKERDLTTPIAKRLQEIVQEIAKKEGISVVVEQQALVWAVKDVDLTDRAVEQFNK